jgi:hypothetical protein
LPCISTVRIELSAWTWLVSALSISQLSIPENFSKLLACQMLRQSFVSITYRRPNVSSEDISITKRLKEAGEIMGIKVLNHIIVGDGE